jgi:hypothetical protein
VLRLQLPAAVPHVPAPGDPEPAQLALLRVDRQVDHAEARYPLATPKARTSASRSR